MAEAHARKESELVSVPQEFQGDDEGEALLKERRTTEEGPVNRRSGREGSGEDDITEDSADQTGKGKSEKRYLFGLAVKKDTTYANVVVMPLLPFITCTINFYAMAFMPLLLEHEDYFAIPASELGKATAAVLIWSQLLPLLATPFLTYVYEAVGRRLPVAYALLTTNLLVWLMPKCAPDFGLLCVVRAVIGLNNTLIVGAPLISDSVK